MFYPVVCAAVKDTKKTDRWAKGTRPRLRQIHTRMAGAYFHRGITRLRAEELLLGAREDGSFLVRDSETLTGAYVLCLLHQSRVHQYRVLPGSDGKLSVQAEGGILEPKYNNLNELIADYIKKGEKNGLTYALKFPVSPERGDEPDSDDDDFEDIGIMQDLKSPSYVNICAMGENGESGPTQRLQMELLKNYSKLNLSVVDPEFTDHLKDYIDHGLESDINANQGGESSLVEYQKVMEVAAKGLHKEMDKFLKKMSMFSELLNVPNVGMVTQSMSGADKTQGTGIPALLEKMSNCRSDVMTLECKVQETLRCYSVSQYDYVDVDYEKEGFPNNLSPFLSPVGKPHIPRSEFEVKTPTYKHGKMTTKMTLTIDIPAGKLFAVKPSKDVLDSSSLITHDRILQLVKNTKDNCTLDMVYDGKKKSTFTFTSALMRENFCQQILQMKNMHSKDVEVDQISIFIGTWNMGDSQPTTSIGSWIKCQGCGKVRDPHCLGMIPHDLYVIGTQESAQTEKDWVNFLKKNIKNNFQMVEVEVVEVCTLWGIRIVILAKKQHIHSINRIQRSTVRTGIANALGNKGAVGISFYFRGTSFCFVNTHLTSGDERNDRRNQNFKDIIKGLSLGQKHLGLSDITNQFHHLFWLGDLNYRVEEKIETLLKKLEDDDIESLLKKDQLKKSQKERKGFNGFSEEEISFKPTYRLPRSKREWVYDWKKVKKTGVRINSPSWCDRVLWRSYPGAYIQNVAYGCADGVLGSDHRPVFASFNAGVASDFVMNRDSLAEDSPTKIVFQQIEAELITYCRQTFTLEFHSTCLPEVVSSKPNSKFKDINQGFTSPVWNKQELPMMKPLFGDQDFLREQHVLISVRSKFCDHESYGECVVALKGKFNQVPQEFESELLHQGEVTGFIRGQLHVLTGSLAVDRKNSKKSYELIALDYEYHDPELMHPDSPKFDTRTDLLGQELNVYESIADDPTIPVHKRAKNPSERPPALIPRSVSESEQGSANGTRPKTHPYMGQASLQVNCRQTAAMPMSVSRSPGVESTSPFTTPPSQPPPPVPRKRGSANTMPASYQQDPPKRYDALRRPSSVHDWLVGLRLPDYIDNFLSNGFDTMSFVTNITYSELSQIGIENEGHRKRILSSLRDLS